MVDKFKDIVFVFPEDPNDLDTIQLLKETVKRDDFKEVKEEYLAVKDKELTTEDVFKLNLEPDDELLASILEFFDRPHIAEYFKEAAEVAIDQMQTDMIDKLESSPSMVEYRHNIDNDIPITDELLEATMDAISGKPGAYGKQEKGERK